MKSFSLSLLVIYFSLISQSNEIIDVFSLTEEEQNNLKNAIQTNIINGLEANFANLLMPGGKILFQLIFKVCIGLDYGLEQQFCYGVSDISTEAAMTPDLNFRIGQVTQTFTAVAILQLVELGQITLNTTIDTFFPALTIPNKESITIYYLLYHLSGLSDYQDNKNIDELSTYTPEELIGLISEETTACSPGDCYSNSNTNYVLLGLIIEQKTEKTYSEAIQQLISEGSLLATKVPTTQDVDTPAPTGYTSTFEIASGIDPSLVFATGSLISNVQDMALWMKNLMILKFLKSDMQIQLLEKPIETAYGLSGILDYYKDLNIEGKFSSLKGYTTFIAAPFGYELSVMFNSENHEKQEYQIGTIYQIVQSVMKDQLQIEDTTTTTDDNSTTTTDDDSTSTDYYSEPFSEREIIEFIIIISLIFLALAFIRV